ncbi:MAG: hypothetical protein ACKV2V_26055 [Blastocatellia bacterium]
MEYFACARRLSCAILRSFADILLFPVLPSIKPPEPDVHARQRDQAAADRSETLNICLTFI